MAPGGSRAWSSSRELRLLEVAISDTNLGGVPHGPDQRRFIKRLGRSRKLLDELRREAASIQGALDALKQGKTARSRGGEPLDPLHEVYVAVQNVSSIFAERVSSPRV